MAEINIIGLGLAKHSFQAHGAAADGAVLFRKKLSRARSRDVVHNFEPTGHSTQCGECLH